MFVKRVSSLFNQDEFVLYKTFIIINIKATLILSHKNIFPTVRRFSPCCFDNYMYINTHEKELDMYVPAKGDEHKTGNPKCGIMQSSHYMRKYEQAF